MIHGQWIDPAKAGDIPKLLDQALASPSRPALAWIGLKGPGKRTVHVKGRKGETAELKWDPQTFGQQIEELARQWGGDSPSGGGNETGIDAHAVYARRKAEMESEEQQPAQTARDELPDAESVYARRRSKANSD